MANARGYFYLIAVALHLDLLEFGRDAETQNNVFTACVMYNVSFASRLSD